MRFRRDSRYVARTGGGGRDLRRPRRRRRAGTSSWSVSTAASTAPSRRPSTRSRRASKSMVKIRPGTYHEGVILSGHRYDKLIITGTTKPEEDRPQRQERPHPGPARPRTGSTPSTSTGSRSRSSGPGTSRRTASSSTPTPGDHCNGFVMDNDLASFNRSYGLFAKHCIGGKITHSKGWGHGDSAIYIGETPAAGQPEVDRHRPRQGLSRTCSATQGRTRSTSTSTTRCSTTTAPGSFPNTLDSEQLPAQRDGKIRDNDIFWNNFNYFLPKLAGEDRLRRARDDRRPRRSTTRPASGVVLFGSDGWRRQGQQHLRQLHVGRRGLLGPVQHRGASTRTTGSSTTRWAETAPTRTSSTSSTTARARATASRATRRRPSSVTSDAQHPHSFLYPGCPAPACAGTGTNVGDGRATTRSRARSACSPHYVLSDPPCSQQDLWMRHSHPAVQGVTPIDTKNFGKCTMPAPMRRADSLGDRGGPGRARGRGLRRGRRGEPAAPRRRGRSKVKVLRRLLQAGTGEDQRSGKGQVEVGPDFNSHNVTLEERARRA